MHLVGTGAAGAPPETALGLRRFLENQLDASTDRSVPEQHINRAAQLSVARGLVVACFQMSRVCMTTVLAV